MATQEKNRSKATETQPPAKSRFVKIAIDRLMYSLDEEECRDAPLVGYVTDLVRMPDSKRNDNPEWYCFVVKTTESCKGVDRDGKVHKTAPGDELHLPATYLLKQKLERLALDPNFVFEVRLSNWKKQDIGGGKKMWRPEFEGNPTPHSRAGFCLLPQGPNAAPPMMLPASDVNGTSDAADATPF